jgi:hypothetical protein
MKDFNLMDFFTKPITLYRGVGLDEALKSCKKGHLVHYSKDPMSMDWEVIEYSLGDEASEMSDDELGEYIFNLIPWRPVTQGINLTSDLENAMGYSDIVLEVNVVGEYAEFSDVHYFAKEPNECLVTTVYYKNKEYSKEEFLSFFEN